MNKPIIMKNTKKNKKHGTNLFRGNSEKVFVLCDMFYALKDIFFEKTAKICLSKKLGVSVSFYMTTAELFSFAPTSCDHQSEVGVFSKYSLLLAKHPPIAELVSVYCRIPFLNKKPRINPYKTFFLNGLKGFDKFFCCPLQNKL